VTWLRPTTWDQAVRLRTAHPEATVLAGGTALQPLFNAGALRPASVLSLAAIEPREPVQLTSERSGVRFDALTTVHQALTNPLLERLFPDRELRWFGVPAVRHRATLVGNLLAPSGRRDLAVLLLLADARLQLRSGDGERELGLADLLAASSRLTPSPSRLTPSLIGPDELVTAVTVSLPDHLRHARAAIRASVAPAAATVAVALTALGPRVVLSIGGRIGRVPAAERRWMDDGANVDLAAAVRGAARVWSGDRRDEDTEYAVHAAGVLARRCHRALPTHAGRWDNGR